ncbi:hypothetical protein AAC387_Pa01g3425 [Persea americana]
MSISSSVGAFTPSKGTTKISEKKAEKNEKERKTKINDAPLLQEKVTEGLGGLGAVPNEIPLLLSSYDYPNHPFRSHCSPK